MGLPDFIIIGAAKSGTTSLHEYLKGHPQLRFPKNKEPNFYALVGQDVPKRGPAKPSVLNSLLYSHSVLDRSKYEALFNSDGDGRLAGEASVRYLYFPHAPARIHRDIPEVKMIAILREPVSRMYSHYCMNRQHQLEPLSFDQALEAEPDRRAAGWGWDWHYQEVGRYGKQLERYFSLFPRDSLRIFLYEDLVERPQWVIEETCRHLGVDDSFQPDMSVRSKPAYVARNQWLDRQLHWPNRAGHGLTAVSPSAVYKPVISKISRLNAAPVPRLSPEKKRSYASLFAEDNALLSDLLGRPIPWNQSVDA